MFGAVESTFPTTCHKSFDLITACFGRYLLQFSKLEITWTAANVSWPLEQPFSNESIIPLLSRNMTHIMLLFAYLKIFSDFAYQLYAVNDIDSMLQPYFLSSFVGQAP